MMTPVVIATNEMHSPVSPLRIYDTMATQDGFLNGSTSPNEATKNATVAVVAGSDTGSPKLPARADLSHPKSPEVGINNGTRVYGEFSHMQAIHEAAQGPNEVAEQSENISEPNHKPAHDHLSHVDCRAKTAASDSDYEMMPKTKPTKSSVKGKKSTKRRIKATDVSDDLPNKDDELSEAQIAGLCEQPLSIRRRYKKYFALNGTIRASYAKILMERLAVGELCLHEDNIRSCLPKRRDRKDPRESAEPGDSSQTGSGSSCKRKEAATSGKAKRVADENTGPQRNTKKQKNGQSSAHREDKEKIVSAETQQPLRIRLGSTPRTALSKGLPDSDVLSKPSTALQGGSSESFASESVKAQGSQQPQVQNQPSQSAALNINPSAVPKLDNPKSFCGNIPKQETRAHNNSGCKLLDPNHLSPFAQNLTGEIQQMDLAIVSIVRGVHEQDRRYALRHFRDVLIELRDLCVDMEIEQRSHTVVKSREDTSNP
ncbi:hypothetical protein F1880_003707 [Penicillium rolfsii]|nr:hypothetical protein F1880_003707 [Penicillium rolfsii]